MSWGAQPIKAFSHSQINFFSQLFYSETRKFNSKCHLQYFQFPLPTLGLTWTDFTLCSLLLQQFICPLTMQHIGYSVFHLNNNQFLLIQKHLFLQRHTPNFQDKNTSWQNLLTNKFQKDIYKFMLHSFLAYNNGL